MYHIRNGNEYICTDEMDSDVTSAREHSHMHGTPARKIFPISNKNSHTNATVYQ